MPAKSSNEALGVLNDRVATGTKYIGFATLNEGLPVEFVTGTGAGQAPGYARVAVTYGDPAFLDVALLATLKNSAIALFAANPGPASWPVPKEALLFDALTGGSWTRRMPLLDQTIVIQPGQAARFPVGAITHTEA